MEYLTQILMISGIDIVIALGLYIQMSTGQLNAAQAAFVGIGAYAAAVLSLETGLAFPLDVVAGAAVAGVAGAAFAFLVLRLSHWFLALATLAFGEALAALLINVGPLGGALGLSGIPLTTTPLTVVAALAVAIYTVWRIERSRYGDAFRAISSDEQVAAAMGINVGRTRYLAFGVGGAFGGVGGALFAHFNGLVQPSDLGFVHSLPFILYVAIGGTRNLWGTVLGALFLTLLPELLRFSIYDRTLIFGVLMIVITIARPEGILPRSLRVTTWSVPPRFRGLFARRGKEP